MADGGGGSFSCCNLVELDPEAYQRRKKYDEIISNDGYLVEIIFLLSFK